MHDDRAQTLPRVRIIMPVGSDPDFRDKQAAIGEGAARANFEADFPDYEPAAPRFHLPDYLAHLKGAAAVIADLTGERPSCYYELGIAESLGLPVYLLAEKGTRIHQTGVRARTCFYAGLGDLAEVVAKVLTESGGSKLAARAV